MDKVKVVGATLLLAEAAMEIFGLIVIDAPAGMVVVLPLV
jgi:hypothetical protein